MKAKCAQQVRAAAATMGRTLTDSQLRDINDRIDATMRRLAVSEPGWSGMPRDMRVSLAAERAMADIAAEAARKAENAVRQVLKQADTAARIDSLGDAYKGARGGRAEMLKRDFELTNAYQAALRKDAQGGLMSLIEAAGDKEGAGLGRRALMAVFDAENPQMTADVVREVYANADGSSGNKTASTAARAWLDTIEGLRQRFNAAGGDVGRLEYGYTPQPHDRIRIRKAGRDAWAAEVLPLLDRKRYVHADGLRMNDDEVADLLRGAWETITTDGLSKQEPGAFKGTGKRANRGSDERVIHFRDGEAWLAYNSRFGRGSLYDAMMGHIAGITRDIALVERYGPDPEATARLQFDLAARADGTDPNKLVGAFSVNPQTFWNMISGKVGMPQDETLARAFETARNIQTAAKLGGAVISSVTDLGTLAITAGYNRLPYWQLVRDIKTAASADAKDFMSAHGMIAESIADGMNRWSGDHMGHGWSGKLANSTMRWSLMNAWTDSLRQGFTLTMNAGLARMTRQAWDAKPGAGPVVNPLSEFDRVRLQRAGITEADWQVLQAVPLEKFKGRDLLTPQGIKDMPLSAVEQAKPEMFALIRQKIAEQTTELQARNAQDQQWIRGRLDKFDDARDAMNRWVKQRAAKRDAKNQEATGPMLERMALLDAQREQAQLQADMEADYNKLFTQADLNAFTAGVRNAAQDLGAATREALSAAERAGRDFGIRKQRIEQRMRDAQRRVADGGDPESALLKMAAQQAELERAELQRDIEIAFKATPDAERAAFQEAIRGVSDVRKSASAGMSAAERIGRRYGEAKGRLERRMKEIESRISQMDRDANRANDADAKEAQKKADAMAADLREFIARSAERQRRRAAVVDRLNREEAPRIAAESERLKNDIAARVFAFINDEAEMAVLNPDMTTRAITTMGGQQAGTWGGEIARTVMQFKSFPIAMISRHWRRMLDGSMGADGAPLQANRFAYGMALAVTTMALGAIAVQAKQILAGKDPISMDPTDGTGVRFWGKAVQQGGGLSILGDLFLTDPGATWGDQAANTVKNLAGPTVGSATELLMKNIAGNIWEAADGKDTHWQAEAAAWVKSNTPGASVWWVKPAIEHGFLNAMNESLSPGYLSRVQQRAYKDWQQRYWWAPRDALPQRAPDFAAAVQ